MVGQGTDRRPWFSFGRDPESSKAESHPGIMGSSPARAPLAFLRLAVVFAMSSCCCPPAGSPCAPSPAPHPHHLHHPHHPQPPEREDGASTFPALAGSSLRLRQDVGGRRGRGLFASRAVVAGSLLLQEDAFAFSPHTADSEHTTRSHLTLKEAPALMRCGGCRFALYASEDEQREAWKHHHSDECASIRRCLSYGYSPSSTLLLASRILHRKRREETRGGQNSHQQVLALEHKYGQWPDDEMALFSQESYAIRDYMGGNETFEAGLDMREVFHLLCRLRCNTFAITDDDMRVSGVGLYPAAALANHDCNPNAVATFQGTKLSLRAVCDIPEGGEVTIAYVDCAEPSGTRARELASRFLFNCTCAKCSRGQEDDEVKRALRCPQGACPGWMQPWGEEDWEPHRRRFVARSFGEHVAQTVAPWGDWLEVGQDAGTLKDEIQGWGGFDGVVDGDGPMLPGLDEDLDRHLEDQLAKASGNGNGQITAKESRKEAARRMRKQIDNFLSWEDKIYGVADPDFSKIQEARALGDPWTEDAQEALEEVQKELADSARLSLLDSNGTAATAWRYENAAEKRQEAAKAVEQVLACCVCGATSPLHDVVDALRHAGMLVGDARRAKWKTELGEADFRIERILAGQPQDKRVSLHLKTQEQTARRECSSPLLESVKSASKVLHPRNLGMMRLLEAAVFHASRANLWRDAALVGESLSACYTHQYPAKSPVASAHAAFMGKLGINLAASADDACAGAILKRACTELTKAAEGYRVTHGADSAPATNVGAMLREVEIALQGGGEIT